MPRSQEQALSGFCLCLEVGLMKNLVKAMSKANSSGFQYLAERFPKMNPAKMKEGIFIGLQIRLFCRMKVWEALKWLESFLGIT